MDPVRLKQIFRGLTGGAPDVMAFAPGRVNLIGEHTDYNDGYVLPAALERGVVVAARRIEGDEIVLHAADLDRVCRFPLDVIEKDPAHPWADYFKGVAWTLFIRGLPLTACEVVVTGDVPQGSGLSSSAAYEVASVLALKELGGFDLPGLEVAKMAREAESGFVGVKCGLMDQVASVFGEEGCAILLDCRSLAREMVALLPGSRIVVANSMVRHELASSEYNRRREECEEAVRILSADHPGLTALRDLSSEDLERTVRELPPALRKRVRHVVGENGRVLQAVSALRNGKKDELRSLLLQSHYSLRDDYEVSCPELDVLVELASALPYCHGARMTGGGFGGCTVNLVEDAAIDPFRRAMTSGYKTRTGRDAEIHVLSPSAGARLIPLESPA